ncbi:MAG: CDP-alcohol phosphatidyltransferase family protein [Gammaproteobacteria bacterium]|nr:CDP-alcohol phosphatidyltransferase family protein [Gammaproteobacteria bacterium]
MQADKRSVFPLVRHLSNGLSPLLAKTPLTPNQITALSLGCGLAAAYGLSGGRWLGNVVGSLLFVLCYVLDNCDGEIARLKNLSSRAGAIFDTAADAVVHPILFAAMGLGVARATENSLWLWVGLAAAAGATINGCISVGRELKKPPPRAMAVDEPVYSAMPERTGERMLFVFRELSRADFCFILLALAVADLLWLLLPAAAVGSQVYWVTSLAESSSRYHV